MARSLALVLFLVACGTTAPSPSPSVATGRPSPTPTPTPTLTPVPLPSFSGSPVARASGQIHYVAIGASDTVGVGSLDPANGSWPSRIAALLPAGSTYRNVGVSGSLTAQAQREQLPLAIREQPTVVTVWLAVNDLSAQIPPAAYGASLAAIVDALVAGTSARIFVGNVPDLRAVPVYAALDPLVLLATVQAYNAQVAVVAAKHAGRVVPVDLFTGSADLTTQITVAPDGFYPSDAGYILIAQRFGDTMRAAGIPLRAAP